MKHTKLIGVLSKSLLLCSKIIWVNLIPNKVQAGIIGGYAAGPAAKVCVQNLVTGFCVMLKYPGIEGNGLLCRMNFCLL